MREQIQVITLIVAFIALILQFYILIYQEKKKLLVIPFILMLTHAVLFYVAVLTNLGKPGGDWSARLRLHEHLTFLLLAIYRTVNVATHRRGSKK